MRRRRKLRLAVYWAAGCGGCEVALLNVGERLLDLDAAFDLAFCPCLCDVKTAELHALPDGWIDLCLFDGAIRNSENLAMASLLRQKSSLLVAFGSCASEGCIPGLANLFPAGDILASVYLHGPSTENPEGTTPEAKVQVPEGALTLPVFADRVRSLSQVERVDYVIPGCPPEPHQIWPALALLATGISGEAVLPPRGTVLGTGPPSVCEECPLPRIDPQVTRFLRPHEARPDPATCLLDQGFVCTGPATRGGCGALCPRVGMGCRGCYGPPDGVDDPGARMVGALAAVLRVGSPDDASSTLESSLEVAASSLVDPVGTLYRHGLAHAQPGPVRA